MEQFSTKPWYPKAVVNEISQNQDFGLLKHYSVYTEFGTLDMFDVEELNNPEKFTLLINQISNLDCFEFWGDLKKPILFEKIEIIENKDGIKLKFETNSQSFEGLFHNFPVKSWRRKWSKLEKDGDYLIPTGGIQWNGFDLMVFRESVESEKIQWKSDSLPIFSKMGSILGNFHTMMLETSAPRMEKEWNLRLKRLEKITSSGTLWRVPYSKNTNSIRSLGNLKISNWLLINDEIKLDLMSLGFQNFGVLITETNRFSSLRDVASMYFEIDNSKITSSSNSRDYLRQVFFESWRKNAPHKWHSKSALDGNLGGMQIWRYDVELYNLFLSRLYGGKFNKFWIKQVKDIQRSLFNYRIISASSLGMLICSITMAFLWPNLSIFTKIIIFCAGLVIYSLGMRIYRNTSLPPY